MKRARTMLQTWNAVVMGNTENAHVILVGKSDWKRSFLKQKHKEEDNIKTYHIYAGLRI
jgi:hypothetical protein